MVSIAPWQQASSLLKCPRATLNHPPALCALCSWSCSLFFALKAGAAKRWVALSWFNTASQKQVCFESSSKTGEYWVFCAYVAFDWWSWLSASLLLIDRASRLLGFTNLRLQQMWNKTSHTNCDAHKVKATPSCTWGTNARVCFYFFPYTTGILHGITPRYTQHIAQFTRFESKSNGNNSWLCYCTCG